MMEDKTYNGWANYETWAVALWLDNEQATYSECQRLTSLARNVDELSRELKAYVEEGQPDLGSSLWADLLGAALGEVDWYEIAEHYWADAHEDDEDDDEADEEEETEEMDEAEEE